VDLYSAFIVVSHSRRSGTDHTVLPAGYTVPATAPLWLCVLCSTNMMMMIIIIPHLSFVKHTSARYSHPVISHIRF